jgi:hypothetical protein
MSAVLYRNEQWSVGADDRLLSTPPGSPLGDIPRHHLADI